MKFRKPDLVGAMGYATLAIAGGIVGHSIFVAAITWSLWPLELAAVWGCAAVAWGCALVWRNQARLWEQIASEWQKTCARWEVTARGQNDVIERLSGERSPNFPDAGRWLQ